MVLDIGVSSMQLDDPERGFSFQMRRAARHAHVADGRTPDRPPPTSSIPREEAQLADILFQLGEERSSRAIARAIVAQRRRAAVRAAPWSWPSLVARVLGREKIAGRHAATRTFQALRIYVNDELGELAQGLAAAERVLEPGGRLVVVTFHSLEDRLVKRSSSERTAGRSRTARAICRRRPAARPPPSFRFVNHRPLSPTDRRSPPTRARARPS